MRRNLLDQRNHVAVEKQDLAAAVVDDERDLLGFESGIDRVQHGADAGHTIEQFEMTMGVPGQCGHAGAQARPVADQRFRELLAAAMGIRIGITMHAIGDVAGDNLDAAVIDRGIFQE